jgi:hypothetical protein
MDHGRAVSMALQEMDPRYGRQALEIVDAETQRTVHQAVDGQAMFPRIDLGEVGGVLLHEMELGGCDNSRIILKGSVVSDVVDAESRPPAQELAVVLGIFGLYVGLGVRFS